MGQQTTNDPASDVRGRRFEVMAENFDEVFWMFNHDFSELLFLNEQAESIYGVEIEAMESDPMVFMEQIHPDDRELVRESIQKMVDGERISIETRVNQSTDYQRWVDVQGVPIKDEEGNVSKIIGSSRDITEQKKAQETVREERDRLETVLNLQEDIAKPDLNRQQITDTVVDRLLEITDCDGAVIELIDDDKLVYEAASGIASDNVGLSLPVEDSLSGACYRDNEMKECHHVERDDRVDESAIEKIDGNPKSLLIMPLEYSGEKFGTIKIMYREPEQISTSARNVLNLMRGLLSASLLQTFQQEQKQLYLEQVQEMAYTDVLTGLNNRRRLLERLEEEIQRSTRYNNPLSFAIFDLDHFKKVNDQHGHPAGDRVLETLARLINEHTRDPDIPGRYGGEEFALILPETAKEPAAELGKRILEELRNEEFEADGETFSVTASMGLTQFRPEEDDRESLIQRADSALYDAKSAGRDRLETR
jgi:diguanylate cyclase (GGDEF)-like protein/PAS domain S-box-containing protein